MPTYNSIYYLIAGGFVVIALATKSPAQPNEQQPAAVIPTRPVQEDQLRKSEDSIGDKLKAKVLQYLLEDNDKHREVLV